MSQPVEAQARTPAAYGAGDIVNARYEILAVLGTGAFSTVYRVYDTARDQDCALKVFGPNFGLDVAKRELRALMSLRHPNVVEVIDVGQTITQPSLWFLKSEYVPGDLLSRYTEPSGQLLELDDALAAIDQILDALQIIHPNTARIEELKRKEQLSEDEFQELMELEGSGLIHRDIKPQNIIRGEEGSLKLLDFNIATPAGAAVYTTSGTPAYTPPELNLAAWDVSPDLFAVGVVLFELLTQRHPYPDRQPRPDFTPPNPTELRNDIPAPIGEVVRRMCLPERSDRFSSAVEMRRALEMARGGRRVIASLSDEDSSSLIDSIMQEGRQLSPPIVKLLEGTDNAWIVTDSPAGFTIELRFSELQPAIEIAAESSEELHRLRASDQLLVVLGKTPERTTAGVCWEIDSHYSDPDFASSIATGLREALLLTIDIVEADVSNADVPALSIGDLPAGHHHVGWIRTSDLRIPLVVSAPRDATTLSLSAVTASGSRRYSAPRGAYIWDQKGKALSFESLATAAWSANDVAPAVVAEENAIEFSWQGPLTGLERLEWLTVNVYRQDGSGFVSISGTRGTESPEGEATPSQQLAHEMRSFINERADDDSREILTRLATDAAAMGLEWEIGKSSKSPDGFGAHAIMRVPGQGAQGQVGYLWPTSRRLDLRLERDWGRGRTFAAPRSSARANAFQVEVDLRSEAAYEEALELIKVSLQQQRSP